jgi:hypothetical protein
MVPAYSLCPNQTERPLLYPLHSTILFSFCEPSRIRHSHARTNAAPGWLKCKATHSSGAASYASDSSEGNMNGEGFGA